MKAFFGVGDAATALRQLRGHRAMISFAYVGSNFLRISDVPALLGACSEVAVDSGAFTTWTKGKTVDVGAYAAFLAEHAGRFAFAMSVDVIGDAEASLRSWLQLRKDGVETVPVWHEGDPLEHLQEYDPAVRLVGLGRIEGRRSKTASFAFYDDAFNAYPAGRFHGLGNSSPDTLEPYPFESFDAVSWQRNANYSQKHGWPWCAATNETRQRAYIEAVETIQHRPRQQADLFQWAAQHGGASP